ncbi:LysM peptidoglycan-binding domain-containing protein [Alicyclobacillus sendaiensis]|uniref:LysM peptidoglycan-binding domain-containing protein n=1 Tax=Alicyclobacillus sendaiensis TaxID=192387 RepID=UPI00272BF019|nr:LysM peptidoglycan-binding domain-containing protein [Alicyclobacillus sendaiensis]
MTVRKLNQYAGWLAIATCLISLLMLRFVPPVFTGWTNVIVAPGQTLWSLAEKCPANPWDVVNAIAAHNHISPDEPLQPGEVLEVPTKTSSFWTRLVFSFEGGNHA